MIDCFGDCEQLTGTWGDCEDVSCDQLIEDTFGLSLDEYTCCDGGYVSGEMFYEICFTFDEAIDTDTLRNTADQNGFSLDITPYGKYPECGTYTLEPTSMVWSDITATSAKLTIYYPELKEYSDWPEQPNGKCFDSRCDTKLLNYTATAENQIKNVAGNKRLNDFSDLDISKCGCH